MADLSNSLFVPRDGALRLSAFLDLSFPTPDYEPNNRLVALSRFLPFLFIPI
ncbi:MAG: hypothetical protein JOZ76_32465 [Bradyrhizobium sp.]|nr:hypothetical protein [Bradyrhizobium sp.]